MSAEVAQAAEAASSAEEMNRVLRTANRWQRQYVRRLAVTDLGALAGCNAGAALLRFGTGATDKTVTGSNFSYASLGILLTLAWMTVLQGFGTRDERVVGEGFLEYRRVVNATMLMFGSLAIVSVVFKWEMSRGYLAIAFPSGLGALLISRTVWRRWLRRERRKGNALTKVLLVGGLRSAREIIRRCANASASGMAPAGIWVPDAKAEGVREISDSEGHLPVYGSSASLNEVIEALGPSLVIVTDSEHVGSEGLRELVWQLSASEIDLMIAPNVVDVASGRLHLSQVAAMSFLHIAEPKYAEAAQWPKVIFDRAVAVGLLVLLSPVFVATALAVKLTSPGPVFYRQRRIGLDGNPFSMMKFRSMRQDADEALRGLLHSHGMELGPLAKLKEDPRITSLGRFIRRYSIDELPQLFNVLKGDMSLVGPRPQRQFEVDKYDHVAHRRLRVRPGVTGLWQVSGRSELTWEDAIRLDTYYVSNWSMTADLIILWKTMRAVLSSSGAY